MPIKPPTGVGPPPTTPPTAEPPAGQPPAGTTPVQPAVQPPTAQPQAPVLNPEAVANALKEYQKIRDKLKQPVLSGAAGLFTDNVVFPAELLDSNNPANDPKYLHLLLAVFGLREMKKFFMTDEQREEEEEMEKEEEAKKPRPNNSNKKNGRGTTDRK